MRSSGIEEPHQPPTVGGFPVYVDLKTRETLTESNDALITASGRSCVPIVDRIPRFVVSENYAKNFGLQWNQFAKTQLDSYTGHPLSEQRLQRCIGPHAWDSLRGKLVLEAGCGAGRFTEILLRQGGRVMSVDLSTAVDANRKNCPLARNHRIIQADIAALPFVPRQFDIVVCLGVIQHTPSSEATIAALYEQVKPGGWLIIDHYLQGLGMLTRFGRIAARAAGTRMEPAKALAFAERLVSIFLPVHRAVGCRPWLAQLLGRFSPIITFYHVQPELPERLQREWAILDTYDAITDRFKHLRTPNTISRTLQELGMEEVRVWTVGNGVEARGRRPPLRPTRTRRSEIGNLPS
jgi:SAM-dependent methyltransferase